MDFNELIHSERGALIRELPKGARTVLSAGCAGAWYFDWFESNYGSIEKHIGLELYSAKPDDLPSNVEWIANSVDDMTGVRSKTVDLLFSGQNIEHLDAGTLTGFLKESNRVLSKGGYLAIDSPNRKITQPIRYTQPEHTLELTDTEIIDLIILAGFRLISINGIWNTNRNALGAYERTLELHTTDEDELNIRRDTARDDPGGSFIWWLVAEKIGKVKPSLEHKVEDIYLRDYPGFVRTRFMKQIGRLKHAGGTESILAVTRKETGYVLYGPYIPIFPGKYSVFFRYECIQPKGYIRFDVCANQGKNIYASIEVVSKSMAAGWKEIELVFEIDEYATGLETRVYVEKANANFKFGSEILKL